MPPARGHLHPPLLSLLSSDSCTDSRCTRRCTVARVALLVLVEVTRFNSRRCMGLPYVPTLGGFEESIDRQIWHSCRTIWHNICHTWSISHTLIRMPNVWCAYLYSLPMVCFVAVPAWPPHGVSVSGHGRNGGGVGVVFSVPCRSKGSKLVKPILTQTRPVCDRRTADKRPPGWWWFGGSIDL